MAIAKIKHIDIFFTKEQKEKVVYLLQKLGIIQLLQLKEVSGQPRQEPGADLEKVEEAIAYLESLSAKKGMFLNKPYLDEEAWDKTLPGADLRFIIHHLSRIRERIREIQIELDRLYASKNNLFPWRDLNLSLRDIASTKYAELLLGIINSKQLSNLEEDIKKDKLNLYFEAVNRKNSLAYILIVYLRKEKEAMHTLLKRYNFNHIILPKSEGTPAEIILQIDAQISKLNEERAELGKEISSFLPAKIKLMILAERLNNEQMRSRISCRILETHYVSLISGWVKEKDLPRLKNALFPFKDLEMILREALPDEDVPVDLENRRLIQPFEFITRIYGMPKYHEIDPTPFLAPFFFLYFGFCISDVGYGLLLALFSFFALKKFKLGPGGVRFFKLFLFCGISTMIIGALLGSWFGNLFDLLGESHKIFLPLKRFKDALMILDPLKEPTKLLAVALAFGIIQVWFGNLVAAIGNIKNRRYLDVLLDQVPMLTLLFGLTGFGFIFLNLLDKRYSDLFKYPTLLATVALILTQGRAEKSIGAKIFYGIYNFYNALSGYLSDIMSYSRLWALGLVTGVMATTINLISIQFSQMLTATLPLVNKIGFIKVTLSSLILAVIFISGHIVSFLMNLLGAFVHPLRLQFVEFFSKFFKSGGSSFKPFKVQTKYINIG